MTRIDAETVGVTAMIATIGGVIIGAIAGFITHLWWLISMLMAGNSVPAGHVVIAIFGTLIPPLGCLHGVWIWFHPW